MGFDTLKKAKVGDLQVAYREEGSGEPLLLIHGWPLSSLTWRKVVPMLSGDARCIALDLLGAGETLDDPARDHGFPVQARLVEGFMDAIGLAKATVFGHDSGGTIARMVAIASPDRVPRLVLADTEVPGHQPALVRMLKALLGLPGARALFAAMTRSRALAKSPLGFGTSFADLKAFDFEEFFRVTLAPLGRSEQAMKSTLKFLRDFRFEDVDATQASYGVLTMPKYVMWGEDDRIFPLEQGWRLRDMLPAPVRFDMFPGAGLLIHEERPDAWADAVRSFVRYSPIG
jgi:pimeloyl-ACP methyl ester carboxylesterase